MILQHSVEAPHHYDFHLNIIVHPQNDMDSQLCLEMANGGLSAIKNYK